MLDTVGIENTTI